MQLLLACWNGLLEEVQIVYDTIATSKVTKITKTLKLLFPTMLIISCYKQHIALLRYFLSMDFDIHYLLE